MNKKKVLSAVLVLVVVAGAAWWFLWRDSPERQVRKRLRQLAKLVGKKPGESAVGMAVKNQRVQTLFADRCKLTGDGAIKAGSHTPAELAAYASQVWWQCHSLKLDFYGTTVEFLAPDEAAAGFTARLIADSKHEPGAKTEHFREVVCRLRQVDGKWLFTEFNFSKIMEK